MTTLQLSPTRKHKAHSSRELSHPQAVSAERVKEMLREIAFILHATRVVGRMGQDVAAKNGPSEIIPGHTEEVAG
jgi:hypothetical protein